MPIIFFILSLTLLYYSYREPSCIYGSIIFAVLGILLMSTPEYKEKRNKLKRKIKSND
jgi:preprotein translocase subunit SecG